jgi:large subunit ribosomal protein L4
VRSYDLKVNVATKKAALRCVLSEKLRENQIVLLESLELSSHRTRDLATAIAKLGITGKALLLDRRENGNLAKAARNNPNLFVEDALGLDAYAALEVQTVILTEQALKTVTEVLG